MPLPPATNPVFPAGYGPLPADFNNWVQSNFSFITNQIVLRVHQTVNQNYTAGVTSGASTIVQYDVVDEDPYGGWNAGPNSWTAPYDGWYEVTVFNSLSAVNVNLRSGIMITGTQQQYISSQHQVSATFMGGGCVTSAIWLVGGDDYVQGQCVVLGANASNDTSATGRYPRMEIAFVSQ